jgi:hypothetical protein
MCTGLGIDEIDIILFFAGLPFLRLGLEVSMALVFVFENTREAAFFQGTAFVSKRTTLFVAFTGRVRDSTSCVRSFFLRELAFTSSLNLSTSVVLVGLTHSVFLLWVL